MTKYIIRAIIYELFSNKYLKGISTRKFNKLYNLVICKLKDKKG